MGCLFKAETFKTTKRNRAPSPISSANVFVYSFIIIFPFIVQVKWKKDFKILPWGLSNISYCSYHSTNYPFNHVITGYTHVNRLRTKCLRTSLILCTMISSSATLIFRHGPLFVRYTLESVSLGILLAVIQHSSWQRENSCAMYLKCSNHSLDEIFFPRSFF